MMSEKAILQRIMVLGGLSEEAASTALGATLAALGERLLDEDRALLARGLPDELAASVLERTYQGEFDVAEFFDRIRRREGVRLGFAHEHGQVVCRVLGETLSEELRVRIERVLPESYVELLDPPRDAQPAPDHRGTCLRGHRTLATGRGGSEHPLSESRPQVAQAHSVVCEANPHADTKMSSATGTTQERLEESLATAHPGTTRRTRDASE